MKIAIDPYMFRDLPIAEMVRTVADIGYTSIEFSPRSDFMPFFLHPRADGDRIATVCVFAWEERARESSVSMLDRVAKELAA